MPFHVPATDFMSDTATGLWPALAQPTSETAKPTITVTVRTVHRDRGPLGVIAPPLSAGDRQQGDEKSAREQAYHVLIARHSMSERRAGPLRANTRGTIFPSP